MEKGKLDEFDSPTICILSRLAYGVWLMDEISQRIPTNIKPFMMYDIACNLVKHLQANNRTYLLEQWKFALPSFHAYGHIATCQASNEH